jgi:hypothetical protein
MKNKIAHLLFFMVVVVATGGCKKSFLEDMRSYEKFDESMFTSETLTGAYIDRLYNYYFAGYRSPMASLVGSWEATRGQSTDEIGGTMTNFIHPNKLINTAAQADGYYGNPLKASADNVSYTRIRYANFLIEKINGGAGKVLSEDFKKTAKGQMYFLRALQYFDLVRVYGGVPIVTTVQNASATDESIKAPRAKTSEVFDQIAQDLDSAAALLPMKWTSNATDFGRVTRAAALAIKSRVLLTAASPLFNANWDNPGDQKWQKALDASLQAETELSGAGFGQDVKTAKDWAEATFKFDIGAGASAPGGEGIFVIPLSASTTSGGVNNGWENTIRPKDYNGGGGISVPKGMIDLFPMYDGSRPVIGSNYDDLAFFKKRDPRFYRTFEFSGEKWSSSKSANRSTWLYRWKTSATANPTYAVNANSGVQSPVLVRKMSNPAADTTTLQNSGTDIFDFRYGELLLNIAECYAAQGKTADCGTYLGKIRQRVYPDSAKANNYGIGILADKYAALEACLYERRVELAYEGKRFWDMQRWMLYDDDASIGDNTNSKLNIPVLNGTARTGYYWQPAAPTTGDPLSTTDKQILIDPDNLATWSAQIDKLEAVVKAKFVITPLDKPMDNDNGPAVNILFRSNYYVSGLGSSILSTDPWLPQTTGWLDYNGAMGTFDYRQ